MGRNGIFITPVAFGSGIWRRVGDAPVNQMAYWIIGPRQSPGGGDPPGICNVAPGVSARFTATGGAVETPDFSAGFGIMGRYITFLISAITSTSGHNLAFDDNGC